MLVPDEVTPTGERAKLLDFGLAKLAKDAQGQVSVTRSHHIMGTPLYMSPEQCRGAGIVDEKSDVYSLGVVLYQLICGRPPFVAEGVGQLISHHISDEPPPLAERAPQAPAELLALVHRLLRKDKDARPTMQEVVGELEKLEGRQGAAGARPPPRAAVPELGLSHGKLKSLLAGALEPESEFESSARSGTSSLQPDMAFDRTMPSGDKLPGSSAPQTLDVHTALAVQTQISAPTLISGPVSSSVSGNVSTAAGELPDPLAARSKRRGLVLATLVGAVGALAVVGVLRLVPTGHRPASTAAAPMVQATASAAPPLSAAPPVKTTPPLIDVVAPRRIEPATPSAPVENPPAKAAPVAAKKPARPRGGTAKTSAPGDAGVAHRTSSVAGKPSDASRKQSFKILD